MEAKEIIVGHCYEAKRIRTNGYGEINDRQVLYISAGLFGDVTVQYDSPTIKDGRRYPSVTMEKFLKWAGRDVTKEMPKGDWRHKCNDLWH